MFQNLIANALKFHDGLPPLVAGSASRDETGWREPASATESSTRAHAPDD